MTTGVNACSVCTRLDPEADVVGDLMAGRCEAFPDGIPDEVWSGDHAHRVPVGDEEILWDGDEAEHATYVDLYEAMVGEKPEGLPNRG